MISVICVYNDTCQMERYLMRGLRRQDVAYELIVIDNTSGVHSCAASVLGCAARRAKGDFLMFVHQDVELLSAEWLRDAELLVRSLPDFGVAGVAGMDREGKLSASVWYGDPPVRIGTGTSSVSRVMQTLDGCLALTPAGVFRKAGFDGRVCRGWYLFVAEYALALAAKGLKAYVLPFDVYHRSTGPTDRSVYKATVDALLRKHRSRHDVIYTTVGEWPTGRKCPGSSCRRFMRTAKRLLRLKRSPEN